MKIIRFALIMLFIKTNTLFAQQSKLSVFVGGGINYTFIYGSDFANTHIKPAMGNTFISGIEYWVRPKFALQATYMHEKKSSKLEGIAYNQFKEPIGEYRKYFNTFFETAALSVRYYMGKQKLQVFVEAGVYTSFLNTERFNEDGPTKLYINNKRQYTYESNWRYLTMNGGSVLGVGICYPIWKKLSFFAQVKNHLGLVNYNYLGDGNGFDLPNTFYGLTGLNYRIIAYD